MVVLKKIFIATYLYFFTWASGQTCDANPGEDFRLCNPGLGLTQVVYLDASDSVIDTIDVVNDDTVRCYNMLYKWDLLGDSVLVENFDSTISSNPVIEFDLNHLDASAIFQIELEIRNDDFSCVNKDTLEIELFPNICPSADGGSNATRSLGCNETLTLDGRESTGDGLDFLWTALNCALLTDFDDSTLVFSIPEATTDAEYLIELKVTDDLGFSNADTVSITIINDLY